MGGTTTACCLLLLSCRMLWRPHACHDLRHQDDVDRAPISVCSCMVAVGGVRAQLVCSSAADEATPLVQLHTHTDVEAGGVAAVAAGPCEVKSTSVPQPFVRNMLIMPRQLVEGLRYWMGDL